jgi:hypothetical protein
MQFGLFGSAAARRGGPEFDSSEGFRDFTDYNIEAKALGFHSTFVVEPRKKRLGGAAARYFDVPKASGGQQDRLRRLRFARSCKPGILNGLRASDWMP